MHKRTIMLLVIIGIIGVSVLIGQSALHDIDRNTRIRGFLTMWGTVYPVWDAKYNLGKADYRWDSLFVRHGWQETIRIDSSGTYAGEHTFEDGVIIGANSVSIDSVKIYNGTLQIYANGESTPYLASQ